MADAPEHIWAYHAPELAEDNPGCTIVAGENRMEFSQEYVRADLVAALEAENQRLRLALRIIAGYEQCLDNLMSNADIARDALRNTEINNK